MTYHHLVNICPLQDAPPPSLPLARRPLTEMRAVVRHGLGRARHVEVRRQQDLLILRRSLVARQHTPHTITQVSGTVGLAGRGRGPTFHCLNPHSAEPVSLPTKPSAPNSSAVAAPLKPVHRVRASGVVPLIALFSSPAKAWVRQQPDQNSGSRPEQPQPERPHGQNAIGGGGAG